MTAVVERIATRTVVINDVERPADDVVILTFGAPDGSLLPSWRPGAHVDVTLPSGAVRQYSLCSDPDDTTYRIAVRRCPDGRGGSAELHDVAATGVRLEISQPRNTFPLVDAPAFVLIAGGIGITALLAAARELDRRHIAARLLVIGRGRQLFADELAALRWVHVDTVDTAAVGRPDFADYLADADYTAVYACGPDGMIADVTRVCDDLLPRFGAHVERFVVDPTSACGDAFVVELARTGQVVEVDSSTSILAAVRAAGVDAPSSCEQGICGTCETRVLAGAVEHRDDILTDAERLVGETMMICVSRCSSGRLTLDL